MESGNGDKAVDLQKALEAALETKARLTKDVRKIEQEIATYREALSLAARRLASDPALRSRFQGMSRREACAILMKEMGGQAKITELVPKLFAAGLLPTDSGKAWYKVRTALEQRPDLFTKVGPGQYALAESVSDEHIAAEELPSNGRPPKPVRDAVCAILQVEGKPLHYTVLLNKLQERGISVGGKDPRNTLLAHLSLDPRFKNVGPGLWALSVWQHSVRVPQPALLPATHKIHIV